MGRLVAIVSVGDPPGDALRVLRTSGFTVTAVSIADGDRLQLDPPPDLVIVLNDDEAAPEDDDAVALLDVVADAQTAGAPVLSLAESTFTESGISGDVVDAITALTVVSANLDESVVINRPSGTSRVGTHPLDLTPRELDLLEYFLRHPDHVLTREALLTAVWPHEAITQNAVEVHVSNLRRKLERHRGRMIFTIRGVGYVMRDHDSEATLVDLSSRRVEMARHRRAAVERRNGIVAARRRRQLRASPD